MPRRSLVPLVVLLALVALPAPAAHAKRLRLSDVAGLPANTARDLAIGPSREVWMTSDAVGSFVARISAKGKLLSTVPVPGTRTPSPAGLTEQCGSCCATAMRWVALPAPAP